MEQLTPNNKRFETLDVQEDCLSSIRDARQNGTKSGLINLATGLGKTYIAARGVEDYLVEKPGARVLYLCHQNDILHQAHETFSQVLSPEVKHGFVFGGHLEDQRQVTYASFQTMNSPFADGRLYEALDPTEFDYVIDDESHHAQADTYRRILDYFKPDFMLGLSATPDRRDGKNIRDIFEIELYRKTLEEALAEGLLTPVRYKTYTDHVRSRDILRNLPEGLSLEQLNRTLFIPRRDEEIAEILFDEIAQIEDPHAMIFCQSIEHAERMAKLLPQAVAIHSQLPPAIQQAYKTSFKHGEIPIACVVDKFNEGIDLPNVNLVSFLRSTSSQRIWLQQLGRGLRRVQGKDMVTVVDLAADIERIDMVLDLQRRTYEIQEDKKIVNELNIPVEFNFSEEAQEAIKLLEIVRERIERRKEELTPMSIEPIKLLIPDRYLKGEVEYYARLEVASKDLELSVEDVLYLMSIYESPTGSLDEGVLRNAFQVQFREPLGIKELSKRLGRMQEQNLVSPVSFRKGEKGRKLWRMSPQAVEALSRAEPYKSRYDEAFSKFKAQLEIFYQQVRSKELTGSYVRLETEPYSRDILHLHRTGARYGETLSTLDKYILLHEYHPGGHKLFESDITQNELQVCIDNMDALLKKQKGRDYELKGEVRIYDDRVEPFWYVREKKNGGVWGGYYEGGGEIQRRMTPGELDELRAKLEGYQIAEGWSS